MKTQEEKIKHVMEAADECYHQWNIPADYHCCLVCNKCRLEITSPEQKFNPSPDDLNELFRLADRLELGVRTDSQEGYKCATVYDGVNAHIKSHPFNLCEALLNALFIATGGKDE